MINKLFYLTALVMTLSLEASMISSDKAFLKDRNLLLEGSVKLDHPSLQVEATSAALYGYDDKQEPSFSQIHLQKDIHMTLDKWRMSCEEATLDLESLSGALEGDKIAFEDTSITPLSIFGKKANFSLEAHQQDPYHFQIQSLKVTGDVELQDASSLKLSCDELEFSKTFSSPPTAILTAKASSEDRYCSCDYLGDRIFAKVITLNPIDKILHMQQAEGDLRSFYQIFSGHGYAELQADHLEWNQLTQTLTLNGHSELIDPSLGSLECKQLLRIEQLYEYDHYVIHSITASGPSKLTYIDEEDNSPHILYCPGEIRFDRHGLTITAKSQDLQEQTSYENDHMLLVADEITVEYTLRDFVLKAHKVHLKGHLKCLTKTSDKDVFKYALADELIYYPLENISHLYAHKGSKVLFWNEYQFIKMSADAIDITQEPSGLKDTIQGKGHVRLYFNAEEELMFNELLSGFSQIQQSKSSDA